MFENTLVSRMPLRCIQHPTQPVTHINTDHNSLDYPLFCPQCRNTYRYKQKHYGHQLAILELPQGISQLCGRLDRDKKVIKSIYKGMCGVKGVQSLLKWQEEKEQHFTSIQKHINTIKFQIDEELNNIIERFEQQLQTQKNRLYGQLQRYYQAYCEKFNKFASLTEPIVAMNQTFKFYSNPNAFFFKLQQENMQGNLSQWLNECKKTIRLTELAAASPAQYTQRIRRYGEITNELMDDLPRIRNSDFQKQLPLLMSSAVREILRSLVTLKEPRSSHIHRATSLNNINDNKWQRSGAIP